MHDDDFLYSPTMHELLKTLEDELSGSLSGLSSEETQVRAAPTKWCIQQIMEHLLLSYAATSEVVINRVAKRAPTRTQPSVPQRLGQLMITRCGIFPPGRTAPTLVSPPELPLRRLDAEELCEALHASLGRMNGAFVEAEMLFGSSRRSISHLILGPMSVAQWRRFHLVHGRHHLKQILAIRRNLST